LAILKDELRKIDMTEHIKKIKHLAVTLDGNGRWATARGLLKIEGHRAGAEAAKRLIRDVAKLHIPNLTLYTISSENLLRPAREVSDIMGLLGYFLSKELNELHRNNVRIKIIGNLDKFGDDLRRKLQEAVILTKNNTGLTLRAALGYGSRAEIANACALVIKSGIKHEDVTEQIIAEHLYDPEMPDVDLFIRAGAHVRMSNFLLWQSAYAELYFTETLWPDFRTEDLEKAIGYFNQCKRNFGYSRDQEHEK
jgi:undecaprenyl diphosphate synthase